MASSMLAEIKWSLEIVIIFQALNDLRAFGHQLIPQDFRLIKGHSVDLLRVNIWEILVHNLFQL